MVGIISKLLVAQIADLVALNNDTNPWVIHHWFSGDMAPFLNPCLQSTSHFRQSRPLLVAAAKASVVLADVKMEEIERIANEINAAGGRALAVTCDVSDEAQVKAMIEKTVRPFGSLDMAFKNAGIISHFTPAIDVSSEEWSRIIATNLCGVWNCLQQEVKQMLKQGGGAIVNCSSLAGLVASPGQAAYGATKHGVIGLTKTIGLEYASQGIRINAVCPGTIETPMIPFLVDGDEKVHKRFVESAPIGRLGQPEEIVDTVLWLCSSGSSYVIGHALAVDGGYVVQ